MREIKFRAWKKSTQKMLPENTLKAIIINSERLTEEEFEDLEIMQYTGLQDKNWKEIYEGDILKIKYPSHETLIKVIFKDWCFMGLKTKNNCSVDALLNRYDLKNSEIIGNIYENQFLNDRFEDLSTPELLNK